MLRLRTLGGLSVDGGEESRSGAGSQRKALALLALLAAAGPRELSRDKLVAYLWPESPADRANHRLTQLIYSLRRDLKAEDLFLGSTDLRLNTGIITTDLAEFTAALEAGDFERAAAAYGGPFLDGFFLSDSAEFDHWLEQERVRLAQRHASAVESLARAATARGDLVATVDWWRQLSQADPLNARMTIGYMEALSAAGDRAGALRIARSHEALLRSEFDAEPDPAVVAVVERLRNPAPAPAAPAIAVLPFLNLTPERENEYFSDGMTDELINALAKVPGLRVVSRTSAFAFKGKETDIRQVGQRLQVSVVLEGAVHRAEGRLRITAQLVNAADGYQLWSEIYDRDIMDVFAIQDDISRTIVNTLKLKLVGDARAPAEPAPRSMEAYHLYLKGRFFAGWGTSEGLHKGIEFFQRAIALDPGYAAPHAGLATAYHVHAVFGVLPGGEAYPKAKATALEALRLDDVNAAAHMVLGCVALSHDWDWTTAEREFRRALELNPNEGLTHFWFAWYLTGMGRVTEAVAEARRSVELDPLAAGRLAHVGHILSLCGRHEEAIEQCEKSLELNPAGSVPYETLGWIHIRQGLYGEALAAFEKTRTHLPAARMLRLGLTHALMGHTEVARQIVEERESLEVGVLPPGNTSYYLAAIRAALGNFDRAFSWMERASEQRLFPMTYVKVDPVWSGLRSDPRFTGLLGRMGLRS